MLAEILNRYSALPFPGRSPQEIDSYFLYCTSILSDWCASSQDIYSLCDHFSQRTLSSSEKAKRGLFFSAALTCLPHCSHLSFASVEHMNYPFYRLSEPTIIKIGNLAADYAFDSLSAGHITIDNVVGSCAFRNMDGGIVSIDNAQRSVFADKTGGTALVRNLEGTHSFRRHQGGSSFVDCANGFSSFEYFLGGIASVYHCAAPYAFESTGATSTSSDYPFIVVYNLCEDHAFAALASGVVFVGSIQTPRVFKGMKGGRVKTYASLPSGTFQEHRLGSYFSAASSSQDSWSPQTVQEWFADSVLQTLAAEYYDDNICELFPHLSRSLGILKGPAFFSHTCQKDSRPLKRMPQYHGIANLIKEIK